MLHQPVEIPYNLEPSELVPDPATTRNDSWETELGWFTKYAENEEEVARMLRAAIVLYEQHKRILPLGQCLHTAIIWERG